MELEAALFFESTEQIYARVFRHLRPRTPFPQISVSFKKYANAQGRVRLHNSLLRVEISDLFENAPAPIQESLAYILISKLFDQNPEDLFVARYKRYLNSAEVRCRLHSLRQQRGRKSFRKPKGRVHDLCTMFDEINLQYFDGKLARPQVGWSLRTSRTTLGHYDPAHNVIVLTNLFDSEQVPEIVVRYVMFHEMLHLRFPTEHRGPRRRVHTEEFRKAERAFLGLEEAKLELERFLGTLELTSNRAGSRDSG